MGDLCNLTSSKCLNNGQCIENISQNTSYCQCAPCYTGNNCERAGWRQGRFDTTYVFLIISITGLCLSVLNNGLCLELCISCRRIRRTNCGIYLIVYSIVSLVSIILLVVDQIIQYYPNQLINNEKHYRVFHCYAGKIGYNMFVYLSIWFSSCVAFERSLVICFEGKMNTSRWRSVITIIGVFAIAGGCATLILLYKCDWDNIRSLQTVRAVLVLFHIITGIIIYLLATLLALISFTRRIRRYGTENGSFIKTLLKLLYTHLFIFIPPMAYVVGYVPYTILIQQKNPESSVYQCGISTGEFIIKVLIEALQGVPYVITWLLFVYPSKVYTTEFYLNTWSGPENDGSRCHTAPPRGGAVAVRREIWRFPRLLSILSILKE